MRKRLWGILLILLLMAPSLASAAASPVDLSYFTWTSEFEALARAQLAAYSRGDLLTPVFTKLSAVTRQNLAKLVPMELDNLEKSLFAQSAGVEYYAYLEGLESGKYSMDIQNLDSSYRKAVELIRAEKKKVAAVFAEIKSDTSVDLDGDGKKETVRYKNPAEEWGDLEIIIDGKKFSIHINGWRETTTAFIFDFDGKQKALAFEYAADDGYAGTILVFYANKKVKTVDVQPLGRLRYNGNNLFYEAVLSEPFMKAFPFAIDADCVQKYGKERTVPVQIPIRYYRWDETKGPLTLKTIGKKTRTYPYGEPFAVIALSGMGTKPKDVWYSEYVALIDRYGVALVLRSDKGQVWDNAEYPYFISLFEGAVFFP